METAASPPLAPVLPTVPVHRFTADKYEAMILGGIFSTEDRVELLNGIISPMSPSGPEHSWGVSRLVDLFDSAKPTHQRFVQSTIRLSDQDVVDPDFALVRRTGSEQEKRLPQGAEIDLIIEVADTSLKRDREQKAVAYAAAGVVEYWVVDVNAKRVWRHRNPAESAYRSITAHERDEVLTPEAFPAIAIRVGDVVGN